MPTEQERRIIEKQMNLHWKTLMEKQAVIDNKWNTTYSIGMHRQEHNIIKNKIKDKDNLKLWMTTIQNH